MNWTKKTGIVTVMIFTFLFFGAALAIADDSSSQKRPKNIIIMVPDGASPSLTALARWYKGEKLNLDHIRTGSVSTHMANSVVTGSAAAATAFASGHKTTARFLGVGPKADNVLSNFTPTADPYVPLATILEGAKLKNMATGLISTSRVTHATPAGFGAHVHDRGMENEIMEQLVYNNIDVVLGGGKRHLYPKGGLDLNKDGKPDDLDGDGIPEDGGKRKDGENLIQELMDRGVEFVTSREALLSSHSNKVWGMFTESHMSPDIDNQFLDKGEPSIKEMTEKAIEILSENENGFFLLVEGSQIDWGAHANDPIYTLSEFLAFDEAVGSALSYADEREDTMVIVFPDHGTGGPTIGSYTASPSYTKTSIEDLISPLKGMKTTSRVMRSEIKKGEPIEKVIKTYWGIDPTPEDLKEIEKVKEDVNISYAISKVISKNHTIIGWTTHGHHGTDVPLWATGPKKLIGHFDNTDIPKVIAKTLGIKLEKVQDRLYTDLRTIFPDYTLNKSNPENVVAEIGEKKIRIPMFKDLIYIDGKAVNLEGIVVYAPEIESVFVPRELKEIID